MTATTEIKAYGTLAAEAPLNRLNISRRKPTAHDVQIEILYCGVCHSDLHTARNEWHGTIYPCVPGHEIVGKVVNVGDHVDKFKIGDTVGVGCIVDSCRECQYCQEGLEQYCESGMTGTYGSLALVGAPEHPLPIAAFSVIMGRKSFAGSMIGGIAETQEMLDFCGEHDIVSDIEMIDIHQINETKPFWPTPGAFCN